MIELLVVIAIIALLAAMIIPVGGAVNRHKLQAAAKAGRAQMELLIGSYQARTGVYPPADTNNPALNPLFYELCGTTVDNNNLFTTKDGSAKIQDKDIPTFFGSISGFINSSKGPVGDEGRSAENFLKAGVKAGAQYASVITPSNATMEVTVLGTQVDGPLVYQSADKTKKINPWRYNMGTPTNNPKTFDLWIDVSIGGKNFRISNWSDSPQQF